MAELGVAQVTVLELEAPTGQHDAFVATENGRPVAPREVALALAFLGSPAASYINGVNLDIDAGFGAALATGQVDLSGRT